MLGRVQYIDYAQHAFPTTSLITPLFHKRLSFSHEREVRGLFFNPPADWLASADQTTFPDGGRKISVDLSTLLEGVYVSPGSPPWVIEAVRESLNAFGESVEPHQSAMADPALL